MNFLFYFKRFAATTIDAMICAAFIVLPDILGLMESGVVIEYVSIGLAGIMLLLKDVFGRSPGKMILGLYIVDDNTGRKPKAWKLMLRNLLLPLWIIDGGICLFTTGRRLADIVLKVRVVEYSPNQLNPL